MCLSRRYTVQQQKKKTNIHILRLSTVYEVLFSSLLLIRLVGSLALAVPFVVSFAQHSFVGVPALATVSLQSVCVCVYLCSLLCVLLCVAFVFVTLESFFRLCRSGQNSHQHLYVQIRRPFIFARILFAN